MLDAFRDHFTTCGRAALVQGLSTLKRQYKPDVLKRELEGFLASKPRLDSLALCVKQTLKRHNA